ncbi:MAG: Nramp family divalent metal transporter [Pirellulaceae bacterium]|nr:Nramp family divalent metal transporter [Pirellulaceae bacterium]
MSDEVVAYDPYALPADAIQEPPASLWAAFRKIGPGIILAGTIVGSGELILTTSLGAQHGFVFLWLILFSCVIKVFVQIELGRYAISSGKPTLGALHDINVLGRSGNWLVWWWFVMLLCTVVQLGGMTGTIGQALNLAFPALSEGSIVLAQQISPEFGQYVQDRREFPWAVVTCLVTMALIYGGGYRRIEWLTTVIVVSATCITVMAASALRYTDYPIRASDIAGGLQVHWPEAGIAAAFAVFGITGVGATELFYYPYWCLEKGYARFVGVYDGSEAWERRARGWIRVMHLDAWVSMVVFTLSTVAFYFMGAAVLHPQGLHPKGPELVQTLSNMYVGPFGTWARILFLIGAGAVLFKTLYLSCAANSRLTVDFLNLVGFTRTVEASKRAQAIRRFCLIYPCLALLFYIVARDPQLMVKIGGFAQAATLPMIASAAVYFRYFKVNRSLQPWWVTDAMLWTALIAIVVVAAYAIPNQVMEIVKMLT